MNDTSSGNTMVALAIKLAHDQERIRRLNEICQSVGCQHALYGFVNAVRFQLPTCTTLPADWREVYFEQAYHMIDPLISVLAGSRQPQYLSHLESSRDFRRIYIEHAADFGLAPPRVAVPMFGPNGETAACIFYLCDRLEDEAHRRKIMRKCVGLAEEFHDDVMGTYGMRDILNIPVLTEREKHAIFLSASGGSAEAIACEMGISKRTVETHLRNARIKLQAKTQMHAVARAVYLGVIPSPDPDVGT